jgi:hypothetical protein
MEGNGWNGFKKQDDDRLGTKDGERRYEGVGMSVSSVNRDPRGDCPV